MTTIQRILNKHGLSSRLPRRTRKQIASGNSSKELIRLTASVTHNLTFSTCEQFDTQSAGIMIFLLIIKKYGIDKAIEKVHYPSINGISRLSAILALLAIKLTNRKRYSHDDSWCFDRGLGALLE
ncbi:MAG: hypothetical protein LBF12_04895 [Christensenellaceae bacterium]|jgi:hypothetical protein|nr:hypothetical protein [Christensenellaceae bacterium]